MLMGREDALRGWGLLNAASEWPRVLTDVFPQDGESHVPKLFVLLPPQSIKIVTQLNGLDLSYSY